MNARSIGNDDALLKLLERHHGEGNNMDSADLTNATVELPPDDPAMSLIAGTVTLVDQQQAWIKTLTATVARLEADNARLREPLAENYQVPKNAEVDTGISRQTLERWANSTPPKVKHKRDPNGQLWIDVVDAKRQRFLLAPG